jgi:hypothetical protein
MYEFVDISKYFSFNCLKKARSEPFDSLSDSETNSSNNNEMADAIEFVQPLLSQKMSITEEDIIKISKAVCRFCIGVD